MSEYMYVLYELYVHVAGPLDSNQNLFSYTVYCFIYLAVLTRPFD